MSDMDMPTNLHALLTPDLEEKTQGDKLTFRLPAKTKETLGRICARHGTTPGAFLRRVCEAVTREVGE